jgi:hypothetical protein
MNIQTAALTAKAINTTARVRELNDEFRRGINIDFPNPMGVLNFSGYVSALRNDDLFGLLEEVQCFEDFAAENEQHDFGEVNFKRKKYFFRIEHLDKDSRLCQPNKSTQRMLTIMHASEQR